MLQIEKIEAGYGHMQALWEVSLNVNKGSITSILGPNGAGKTTLLKSIMGLIKPTGGKIIYEGNEITNLPPHKKVSEGLILVPEGKHLFTGMTVHENLIMGAYPKEAGKDISSSLEIVHSIFPILKEKESDKAGSLSGGQQQMVTIGRALMGKPKLIMLDEPSQGLAPKLVMEVFAAIDKMKKEMGLTILLVEQNVETSLNTSDYIYVMEEGKIEEEGTPAELKERPEIREAFLGL
jgi:branched-chain amino acid transport system ATP-binding protein